MSAAAAGLGLEAVPRLLRYRARMLLNTLVHGSRERRTWALLIGVGVVCAMLAGYQGARTAMAANVPSPARLEPVLAGGLAMLAGFTAVTSITFALGALYFARDLDTLLGSPLRPRAVILLRLCVQLATGMGIGTLLATPPLLAYLVLVHRVWALPLVGLAVVAMAASPLAVGTLVTVLAVRVLPARRVRDAGGLLITGLVFLIVAVNLLVRGPEAFVGNAPGLLDPSHRAGVAGSPWLPTGWAVRSVVAALGGSVGSALVWMLPLLVAGGAAMVLVAVLGEPAFVTGFQRSAEAAARRRRRSARAGRERSTTWSGPRPLWLVLALKDLREVRRDPAQLGQLLLPIALFAFYIADIASPGSTSGPTAGTRLPSWFGIVLTAGFASLFAASGIALRAVGTEGRRLWVLRSAPVEVSTVLRAKFAVGFAIAGGLGLGLLWVGVLRSHQVGLSAVGATGRLLVVIAGLVGLATGMGAVRPRLDWTDPRRSVGLGLSLLFMALGSGYLGFCFVILGLPYATGVPDAVPPAAADLGVVVVAGATLFGSLRLGAARLRVLEL